MKILAVGPVYADSFARNIVVTLQAMGHAVLPVEDTQKYRHMNMGWIKTWSILERAFPAIERRNQRGVVPAIRSFQPNLVLITSGDYAPQIIHETRRSSETKLVAWYPDHLANLERQCVLASHLDAWLFKDRYMGRKKVISFRQRAYFAPLARVVGWSVWDRSPRLGSEIGDLT